MKVLFLHQNMPGQYKHIAKHFAADKNNQVYFITKRKDAPAIPGVTKIRYDVKRDSQKQTHRYLINFERAIFHGQEVWRVCNKLKKDGFVPDVICVHPGWGEGLFLKDVYPDTPVLAYQEFYYHPRGADVDFEINKKLNEDDHARIRIKNSTNLFGVNDCDWAISPTFWQQVQFPEHFRSRISVLHDGVDTDYIKKTAPWGKANIKGQEYNYGDEVITYITRNFEHYRGFETFVKALSIIQKQRPKARVIAVGSDGAGYGAEPEKGKVYRFEMLKKYNIDTSRVNFVGYLKYDDMLTVMRISSVHVYLTVPFVLSWSMLEAMASGCVMVASKTQPVEEVIEHGKNGLLAGFFDAEEVAQHVNNVLDNPKKYEDMRDAARRTVEQYYALNKVLPLHIDLIKEVAHNKIPIETVKKINNFHKACR